MSSKSYARHWNGRYNCQICRSRACFFTATHVSNCLVLGRKSGNPDYSTLLESNWILRVTEPQIGQMTPSILSSPSIRRSLTNRICVPTTADVNLNKNDNDIGRNQTASKDHVPHQLTSKSLLSLCCNIYKPVPIIAYTCLFITT